MCWSDSLPMSAWDVTGVLGSTESVHSVLVLVNVPFYPPLLLLVLLLSQDKSLLCLVRH